MGFKGTMYYRQNCEEDYITTPISVLRYITELENEREEMLEMLELLTTVYSADNIEKAKLLIKKATTI